MIIYVVDILATIAVFHLVVKGYRSLVRRVICPKCCFQIPKFDAKPNHNPKWDPNPSPNANPNLVLTLTQTLTIALTLTMCLYISDK